MKESNNISFAFTEPVIITMADNNNTIITIKRIDIDRQGLIDFVNYVLSIYNSHQINQNQNETHSQLQDHLP